MRLVSNINLDCNFVHVNDIDKFNKDDIFYYHDVIFQSNLNELISKKNYPACIVNDHSYENNLDVDCQLWSAPFWTRNENYRLIKSIDLLPRDKVKTKYAFNFMINKKAVNRYLLIKLVEILKFTDFNYSWSGVGREFDIIDLTNEIDVLPYGQDILYSWLRHQIGLPISLRKKFINFPDQIIDDCNIKYYGSNSWTWNHGLNDIFNDSAISLISETVYFEKSSVLTEKTLYSIYGLTFPLFVGGYGHCDAMTSLGFDMFEDIFDHSYQYKPTLFERCYQAIRCNHHLLSDLNLIKEIRQANLDRLVINRDKLLTRQFDNKVQEKIQTWPKHVVQITEPIWGKTA